MLLCFEFLRILFCAESAMQGASSSLLLSDESPLSSRSGQLVFFLPFSYSMFKSILGFLDEIEI